MHQFHRYNPAQPRTVTSFKGNQKLIFEGYRYNIHHIVPTKGVKTWRCVCAKKLNGSRSWCKGRAETWDGDSQGVSKGEHNHQAEHEVAELEFFRSQLILAAISSPQANLNDLIDEATALMSEGVNFGSRESLKKSLTGARKQAENGGFKLKCYKSADKPIKNLAYNKLVRQPSNEAMAKEMKEEGRGKGGTAGNVLQLLALAKAGNEAAAAGTKQTPNRPNGSSSFTSAHSLLDSSGFHSASSLSSTFSSPASDVVHQPNSTFLMTMVAAAAAALGNGVGAKKVASAGGGNGQIIGQKEPQNAQIIQRKKARVNSIFNRLSTKAAAAAASSSSCSSELTSANSGHSSPSSASEMKGGDGQKDDDDEYGIGKMKKGKKAFSAAATQTEEKREELTSPDAADKEEEEESMCRVVRVCCCENRANCTGGRKRKWAESGMEKEGKMMMEEEVQRDRSAPPSSCSSVENQPHQRHQMSPAKEGTELPI